MNTKFYASLGTWALLLYVDVYWGWYIHVSFLCFSFTVYWKLQS